MAEKKKVTKKNSEEEKKKKNNSSKEKNTKKNNTKKAVSSKKDTAKVVNKTNKIEKKSSSPKKVSEKKNIKKDTKPKKEENSTKEKVLEAMDKELLKDESYIKNQYKKEAIERIEEEQENREPIKEKVEGKGVLEELIGKPQEETEKKSDSEDTGIFSSKVVVYLFIILILIICTIFYVYNEDTKKNIQEETEISKNEENVPIENKQPDFTSEAGTETVKTYFTLKKNIEYNPMQYLQSCGFTTSEKVAKYTKIKSGSYYMTDIVYDNLKKNFEDSISRGCFEVSFSSQYQNMGGTVSCKVEQGPLNKYEVTSVERIKSARPTLKVQYTVTPETGEPVNKTNTFEFQVVKGKWVISSIK